MWKLGGTLSVLNGKYGFLAPRMNPDNRRYPRQGIHQGIPNSPSRDGITTLLLYNALLASGTLSLNQAKSQIVPSDRESYAVAITSLYLDRILSGW